MDTPKSDFLSEFEWFWNRWNSENYLRVVEALSKKRMGLTGGEILQETGLPDNGSFSDILKDRAESDFIRPYNYFGKKKQEYHNDYNLRLQAQHLQQ